ncbi:MAG: class II fructose-bisphosphatase [Candidatus Woesearchaeota archaeon]|nr:class II fructose-bisphosphatase [Candidatus Woesearchaeota archaeon]|tara:strand:+ start:68 stop:1012 length:945 start_codon:yes stop_codon:yes gene_type:complete
MDRNIALEFVRATEVAAIAASKWLGKGEKKKADGAAVDEMRKRLNDIDFHGKIVIGEGEIDEAPMLYIGEEVGKKNGVSFDIAVDPLECTDSVAYGRGNAICVFAASPKGCLLHAPEVYMNKIAVGPNAKGSINIDSSVKENITAVARKLNKEIGEITVVVLDRPRHEQLIEEIRETGARIKLITDGDISGAISPSVEGSGIDILMGIGKAPEGVIAASALKCLGGEIQARFVFKDKKEKQKAEEMGIDKPEERIFHTDDLAKGNIHMFVATGVTDGPMLRGVRFEEDKTITHSIVMRSRTGTIRFIEAFHRFD